MSDRIKLLKERLAAVFPGTSYVAIAKALGVTEVAMRRWRAGTRRIPDWVFVTLALMEQVNQLTKEKLGRVVDSAPEE